MHSSNYFFGKNFWICDYWIKFCGKYDCKCRVPNCQSFITKINLWEYLVSTSSIGKHQGYIKIILYCYFDLHSCNYKWGNIYISCKLVYLLWMFTIFFRDMNLKLKDVIQGFWKLMLVLGLPGSILHLFIHFRDTRNFNYHKIST